MLQLSDIWQGIIGAAGQPPAALADQPISAVVVDSRAAQPGALFVALRGEKTDGHLYLADAFGRGAVAALAEPRALDLGLNATFVMPDGAVRAAPAQTAAAPYVFIVPDSLGGLQKLATTWRERMPAVAIGITGSVGKTTTKEIVANVLEQRYTTQRNEGNLNNEIGLPLTLLKLTPQVQRIVLEMGMYDLGEIASLCRLAKPRIGIVTNVGPDAPGTPGFHRADRAGQIRAGAGAALG